MKRNHAKKKLTDKDDVRYELRSPHNLSGSKDRKRRKAEFEKHERVQRERANQDALLIENYRLAKKSDEDCAERERQGTIAKAKRERKAQEKQKALVA